MVAVSGLQVNGCKCVQQDLEHGSARRRQVPWRGVEMVPSLPCACLRVVTTHHERASVLGLPASPIILLHPIVITKL